MEISIRDVEPSDAAGLVRVLNPIIEARCYTVLDTPVSVETEFDYIIDFQDRGIWKVAVREPDRTIVGFQVLELLGWFVATVLGALLFHVVVNISIIVRVLVGM